MEKTEQIIFYSIDRCIKTYRQLAQERLSGAGFDLTVDQWLVMNVVREHPDASQQQIASAVFKDNASVTRIIDLLVTKGYLKRSVLGTDRRKSSLLITAKGKKLMTSASRVVKAYRTMALKGVSQSDLDKVRSVLNKIIDNCG
jgi:DNA-binding MarR family transcriptional regulator